MKRTAAGLEYELTRKAVKNLNLRLRPDGSVAVSVPRRVPAEEADRFVERNAVRIRAARERLDRRPGYLNIPDAYRDGDCFWLEGKPYRLCLGCGGPAGPDGDRLCLPFAEPLSSRDPALTAWLKARLEPRIQADLELLKPRLAAFCSRQPGPVRLRLTLSRWGSCNTRTGELHFSVRLAHLPPEAVRAVVAHELAHLAVPNHSRAFYQAVERILPDYSRRQALLRPPAN